MIGWLMSPSLAPGNAGPPAAWQRWPSMDPTGASSVADLQVMHHDQEE